MQETVHNCTPCHFGGAGGNQCCPLPNSEWRHGDQALHKATAYQSSWASAAEVGICTKSRAAYDPAEALAEATSSITCSEGRLWFGGLLFLQKYIQEGVVNATIAVIFDKSQFFEAIHKEANSGSGCANHLRLNFLADLWNHCLGLAFFAKQGEQQQNPRQSLFAGIEKLIDQVSVPTFLKRSGERIT